MHNNGTNDALGYHYNDKSAIWYNFIFDHVAVFQKGKKAKCVYRYIHVFRVCIVFMLLTSTQVLV